MPLLRSASFDSTMSVEDAKDIFAGGDNGDELQRSRSLDEALDIEGLTLYEKKCILINREIDSHGMGKYQRWIWALCGFGYLLDLLWAQAFGLVLSPIKQEFGFGSGSFEIEHICPENADGLRRPVGQYIRGVLERLDRWSICLGSSRRHCRWVSVDEIIDIALLILIVQVAGGHLTLPSYSLPFLDCA